VGVFFSEHNVDTLQHVILGPDLRVLVKT